MALEFAGNKMKLVEREDGSATITFDDRGIGRSCGGCTLCCKLLPVLSLGKRGGQKCAHQRFGKGCTIYATRPRECRSWSCRWLCDARTHDLPRPDRAHYVIDLKYDKVVAQDKETRRETPVSVLQVWVDPAFPDAHRAPSLRAYMARLNIAAVVRFNQRDGFLLAPPKLSDGHNWLELPMQLTEVRDGMGVPVVMNVEGAPS